jgi:murein DD-endopeptidase MepM/ murein hydrolase activator NlpD
VIEKKQQKKTTIKIDLIVSSLLMLTLIAGYRKFEAHKLSTESLPSEESKKEEVKFGYDTEKYHMSTYTIQKGEILGNIFSENGLTADLIDRLAKNAKDIFSVNKIRPGRDYHIVKTDSCSNKACALIYEASPLNYVIYDLNNLTVKLEEKPVEVCTELASGEIESSLWNSLESQDINPSIIDKMEDALASSVDFYHTQKGDKYKIIYEKQYSEGKAIGLGRLIGAMYENQNGKHYSVYYDKGEYKGYYDYQGRAAKAAFLMSPLKFARISSGFNMARFHPIRRRTIPHLGTDYAAPYGTPIRTVADGVVEEAAYGGGNGRYVKVRHDKTYQTQYLHMQGFASGMRKGKRVQQGETIGYVGSTGLATGPHVCFRFWKNGQQINHLRQKFQQTKTLPKSEMPNFFERRDEIKLLLDQIPTVESKTTSEKEA